jgi:signal transduction histidine kinase
VKTPALRRIGSRGYILVAASTFISTLLALALSWTAFGRQLDEYAYDFLFRLEQPAPWKPDAAILAIDEATLARYGGITGIRSALADGIEKILPAKPKAIAVDVILAEPGTPEADHKLEKAFALAPNLVLSSDLAGSGAETHWEEPIARFAGRAVAIGQVHADLDKYDAVSRDLPLEKVAGHERRWALALAAWSAANHAPIIESPEELVAGSIHIPAPIRDGRVMRIRYAPLSMGGIPRVSIADLDRTPGLAAIFSHRTVFAGVTAQTAVRDRWMTPYSNGIIMPGIEIHANAYETIARGLFLVDAPLWGVAAVTLALAALAASGFGFGAGIRSNMVAAAAILASQLLPAGAFARSSVWPWLPATLSALFATSLAATWRHLIVRRQLTAARQETNRYQNAMHFAIHELRTPLTAIQGSSELISRYSSMPESKRTEIANLINSESKRLGRMIETFLSVERLSAGELELRSERFPISELVEGCAARARPIAERKNIEINVYPLPAITLSGDRELMEYAVYNLLTNAVKYSPPHTRVTVSGEDGRGDRVRLSVADEGIGMDKTEVSRIFEKFYRTKRAEQSGETGTGIGLSIVEQIVTRHGGAIQVDSEPGKGSRFTLVLKRAV